jgi:hypothetical protein
LGEGITTSVLDAAQEVAQDVEVFCVNGLTPQFTKLQKRYANSSTVKCYQLPQNSIDSCVIDIESCIEKIKLENEIGCFDVVLIDISEMVYDIELSKLSNRNFCESEFFILEDINTLRGYREYQYLSSASNYILESQNPCLRGGHAIFKRIS